MAGVSLENWVERIRDPKIECMSRDEMADLQSRRLVDVVRRDRKSTRLNYSHIIPSRMPSSA